MTKLTCKTCKYWHDINGGECHYCPPPILVQIYRMLGGEPHTMIDWDQVLETIPSPVPHDHFCSEHYFEPKEQQ